ncbi:energy transducer TonB [Ketobacter sp.]|uniref:energy transducer TonB n=1 Tax=Ketobacter sp. TaxID=2083498 RepID=UPI000F25A170|nr:energy transducer TonB [Ketobacter sp.]RLT99239.1 MAG: energy transducer TonB [Ketobacter sp.]
MISAGSTVSLWDRIDLLGAGLVSVMLHFVLGLVLFWSWQPLPAPPSAQQVLQAELYRPAPAPAPLPTPPPALPRPAPPPELAPEPPPEPAAAELARLRKERLEQERLEEQKRKQREREEQAKQEQARKEQEKAAQLAAQQAAQQAEEQARLAAERWAANNHSYAALDKPTPDYPPQALDRGIEGDCTVEYTVTAQGSVAAPKVVGQCHPLFIQPSLRAAQAFRYQPARVDGKAQPVSGVRNTFHYRIEAVQ